MESDTRFAPKPEKPSVLFHASPNGNIDTFEPRAEKTRDEAEGPRVFATPSKALATMFLVDTDDSWVKSGTISGRPYIIISDPERFRQLDQGSYIYHLPSDSFETDLDKGLREFEYTSTEAVQPIEKEYFPSALNAMVDHGVKVCFADQATWQAINEAEANGTGEAMIESLEPIA